MNYFKKKKKEREKISMEGAKKEAQENKKVDVNS